MGWRSRILTTNVLGVLAVLSENIPTYIRKHIYAREYAKNNYIYFYRVGKEKLPSTPSTVGTKPKKAT
jgi:hypothetical protein